jgi:hypothetical protein
MGPIKLSRRFLGDKYILMAIDYHTKWVEAQALCMNIVVMTTRFIYAL